MKLNSRRYTLALSALGVVSATTMAHAAVVVATESDRPEVGATLTNTAYTPVFVGGNVSSTDLLNGLTPSASEGNFTRESTVGGLPALTDGTFDTFYGGNNPDSPAANRGAYATIGIGNAGGGAGLSVTYALGGAFNLTEIVVYGGWVDGGRDEQNLDVLVSSDGTNFTSLGASLGGNLGTLRGTATATGAQTRSPNSHRNSITDNAGDLATNVTHVRFDQLAVENGYTGYSEFDVFGTAIPEPSSAALLGLGALGLLTRRKR